jgi:hypothetical protein
MQLVHASSLRGALLLCNKRWGPSRCNAGPNRSWVDAWDDQHAVMKCDLSRAQAMV